MSVEQWFKYIFKVTQEKVDVSIVIILMIDVHNIKIKEIEDEINLGQIEEVIEMAKDELELVDFYYGFFYILGLYESILYTSFELKKIKAGNWWNKSRKRLT